MAYNSKTFPGTYGTVSTLPTDPNPQTAEAFYNTVFPGTVIDPGQINSTLLEFFSIKQAGGQDGYNGSLELALKALYGIVGTLTLPGYMTVPIVGSAYHLTIQWFEGTFNNGGSYTTSSTITLPKTWTNGQLFGFAEDSGGAPQFQYGINQSASTLTTATMTCQRYFLSTTGTIADRSTLTGACAGFGIAFGV